MQKFTQNIINIYGKQGEKWLAHLPMMIDSLADHWKLNHLVPVDNMTFHYVAKAITNNNQAVVLKISCDEKTIADERQALMYFNGDGCIQLIDYHPDYHALLLQQATPGTSLTVLYPTQVDYVMDCYVDTMKKLHSKCLPKQHYYRHISDWLKAIDNLIPNQPCPAHLLAKAIHLKNKLLTSMTTQIFIHGDLHHDNILKNGNEWLAIDPKGIIGEPAFEIAAFDFMYVNELANNTDIKNIFETRINLLAEKVNLDAQRIKDWVFVRLILMAAWHVEDNSDPSSAITLAETFLSA
jgi:streptomycin 6-kinase